MSSRSIHIHYNHDPVQAQLCTQRAWGRLTVTFNTEVVRSMAEGTVRLYYSTVGMNSSWRLACQYYTVYRLAPCSLLAPCWLVAGFAQLKVSKNELKRGSASGMDCHPHPLLRIWLS